MSLVAVAVCPHPPLLVPEVAGGAVAELDDLRAACVEAIGFLRECGARSITVVGSGSDVDVAVPWLAKGGPVVGSLADYGVPLRFSLADAAVCTVGGDGEAPITGTASAPSLPLSLTVAIWLLRGTGAPVRLCAVPAEASPAVCEAWTLPEPALRPWALLVMGDGTARRGEKAPGYADPRAEAFDAHVAAALAEADTDALLALDPALAADLMCAGRAPWQVMAGAVARERRRSGAGTPRWPAKLLYHEAPYGVAYFVATWRAPATQGERRRGG